MTQKIEWTKTDMGGWNRYEGCSQDYGPYIIEKEDTRSYSVWWGHFEISDAETVAQAKVIATAHARSL